jgi:membrane protease YdiL (CAAX protease family)
MASDDFAAPSFDTNFQLPTEPNTVLPADVWPQALPDPFDELLTVVPVEQPWPGFWGSVLWWLAFLGVTQFLVALVVMVGVVAVALSKPGGLALLEHPDGATQLQQEAILPLMIGAQVASWLFALAIIRLRVGRDWTRRLALRSPPLTHLVLVTLGVPALIILGSGYVAMARHILPSFASLGMPGVEEMVRQFAAWPWQVAILTIGLGPAIGEELWCRGFLGRGLMGRYGVLGGVVLTSLLFGLIHVDPLQGSFAMLIGLALHGVYLLTRSLWAPMLVHFLNNSLAVTAPRIPYLHDLDEATGFLSPWLYLASACLLAAVAWALYQGRARLEQRDPTLPAWQPDFPSVEYPPPGTGTVVVRPWPGWAPGLAVLAALRLVGAALALRA